MVFVPLELCGERGIAVLGEARVLVQDVLGIAAGVGQDEPVLGQGGNVEADGKAALLGAFQVSGAAHLHVFLGQFEAVFRGAQKVQALLAFLGHLGAPHKDTIGALRAASHPAAQLVQLAQAKAFRAFDHHHGGIGHINPYLYNGSRNQNVGAAGHKSVHVKGLFLRGLLSMDDSHLVLRQREGFHNFLVPQFQVLVVQFFALENERIHNECLPALGYLVPDKIVHGVAFAFSYAQRLDRLAARGHFVNDGNVQVSVQGHGQGARNGRGGHYQHMRRNALPAFVPEAGALLHAKTVLLIHDGQSQCPEMHGVFYERMRADEHADASILQAGVNFPAVFYSGVAGKERHPYARGPEVLGHIGKMLLGQDFRRCHETGLVAVSHGDEGTEYRYHGFAGTYVSLQQAVHLVAAAHIVTNFPDHALLRIGELVRQRIVTSVEGLPDGRHLEPDGATAADIFLLEQGQLQQEEFFKFEPVRGLGQGILIHREMDLP